MPLDYRPLRGLTARAIISAPKRDGFYLWRQKGSHQQYHHPDGRKATVSFHAPGETFALKTLKAIVETQAQWNVDDLRRLDLLK
jgi:predicted RNA binding protein YcfA (HicA-like mRNA interferase family)